MSLFDQWTEGFLSKKEAEEVFAPYAQRLASCWWGAWTRWKLQDTDFQVRMTPATRAGILQNLAASFAREVFAGEEKVRIDETLGFFKIYIDDKAIVRLKRLGSNHLAARNRKSKRQRRYYQQLPIKGLVNGLTRITVGYILNVTKTDTEEIAASFQIGDDLVYWFPIDAKAYGKISTPIPIEPIEPTGPTVRPANEKKKAANDE
jgi:hypothetical protein